MIINRQKQLQGEPKLSDQEMSEYIKTNFPTFSELSNKNVTALITLAKNQLLTENNKTNKTGQNGGSKGKNKTLKNRRQRFNIRLV